MKKSARNLIQQIKESNNTFDVQTFPVGILESDLDKEEALKKILDGCEKRKMNFDISYSEVSRQNNHDIFSVIGSFVIPSINILNLCGLLLSAIKELDNEVLYLKGEIDQLEAKIQNKEDTKESVKI